MTACGAPADGVAYLDETTPNAGPYAAIAGVTVVRSAVTHLEADIRQALGDLSELKFSKLSDGRQARAALKIMQVVFDYCERDLLRSDALSWDKTDSRHTVAKRDDYANMGNMLRHLLRNALLKWPEKRYWKLCHDRQDQVDYKHVARGTNKMIAERVAQDRYNVFDKPPEITRIAACDSREHPIVQVADLFAGLAVYLRGLRLDALEPTSKAERARGDLINLLLGWLPSRALLHFREGDGLLTERAAPINFWSYRPQGDYDHAPAAISKREPRLVACIESGCPEYVLDEWGLREPRCQKHYREHVRDLEEGEERDRQRLRANTGTHFCEDCVTVFVATPNMKRLNEATYEYEYACPLCGSTLIEADAPYLSCFHDDKHDSSESYAPRPKDVRLPRQSYRDDD